MQPTQPSLLCAWLLISWFVWIAWLWHETLHTWAVEAFYFQIFTITNFRLLKARWKSTKQSTTSSPSPVRVHTWIPSTMHPNPLRVFQVHPLRTFPAGTTRNINCTSENYGIAKAQTALHHWHDLSLAWNNLVSSPASLHSRVWRPSGDWCH